MVSYQQFNAPSQNVAAKILDRHACCVDACRAVIARTWTADIGQVSNFDSRLAVLTQSGFQTNQGSKGDQDRQTRHDTEFSLHLSPPWELVWLLIVRGQAGLGQR
jgi:hypothetical protein